jgi:hypothetical protein
MGLARHNPRGQLRLGLSATAGSAVLYSAIVLFGVGSASPSALDGGRDRHASVVLIQPHADIVSGSVQRLPQASPEPRRHRSTGRAPHRDDGVGQEITSAVPPTAETAPAPAAPRETAASPGSSGSSTAPVAGSLPDVIAPLPVLELPVPLPDLPVPLPDLPVPLPDLPATPPLPLP